MALKALTTSSLQKCALAVTAATTDGGLTSGPQAMSALVFDGETLSRTSTNDMQSDSVEMTVCG